MRKMYIALSLFLLTIASATLAQQPLKGTVRGNLADTLYKDKLAGATVSVLHANDSTVLARTVAGANGEFQVTNIPAGLYRLMVTYQGYEPFVKKFMISQDFPVVDMKTLFMEKKSTTLAEVVVQGPPIQVKGDTTEFRTSAFQVKPNATAEDVLKKLPGVEVDKDGNVQAQGENVQKVYVDGKEFFGTDPKMATKNITADMIESIQVFDDMSDQAKFTRIDDGSRQKTLNIKLKKDMRKGYFGRLIAGGGTDDRYETSLLFNRFNGDRRISILAASNNLNKASFSFQDIVNTMGGFGSRGSGGIGGGGGFGGGGFRGGGGIFNALGGGNSNGITKTSSAGINYSDKWGSKIDVTGSYFFNQQNNNNETYSVRQTFFPNDSTTSQTTDNKSWSMNQNHRFNLRMEYYIDSSNSILYTPNFTLQHSESNNYDTNFTHTLLPGKEYLSVTGLTRNSNLRDGVSMNNNFLYRHRFGKFGRTFTFGWNNSLNNSDGNGTSYAPLVYYRPDGTILSTRNQDLVTSQKTRSHNNVLSASYTEPVGNNKLIEINYAYTNNQSTSDRKAFDYNSGNGKYDVQNLPQTNYFENGFVAHRAGMNFQERQTKYNYQLGFAVQQSELTSRSIRALTGKDTTLKQSFVNFFPTANFQYSWSRSKNLRIRYYGRTNQPSINQLQDVPDVSNPQQVITGNPALKQEFNNRVFLNYSTFNMASFKFLNIFLSFNNTSNKIVNSIDSLPKALLITDSTISRFAQYIKPVNMNGAYNTSSFITLGLPLRGKLTGSSFNFTNRLSFTRDVSMLYKETNYTNSFTASQKVGINFDFKQKLNLGVNASLAYNTVTYSSKNLNSGDLKYYTQVYNADISFLGLKNWVLGTNFDCTINTGLGAGYNQTIPLWNASLARQVFKKKNGELKFSVNDILNQNKAIIRSVGDNYIQDARYLVIKRYFLLTFTYNLRKGNGQQNNMRDMPPGMERRFMMHGRGG